MQNFHEEEILGKAYDARLMRRLLVYAKPFWVHILISIILLFLLTGIQLLRPYLIKIAIDDHINVFDHPYLVFNQSSLPAELSAQSILYQDNYYIRSDQVDLSDFSDISLEQLVPFQDEYYLIKGVLTTEKISSVQSIDPTNVVLRAGDREYRGQKLTGQELQMFRQRDADAVMRIALIFAGILVIGFALNYGQVYLLQWTGQKIIFNIRQALFSHIERLSLSFFDQNPVGRLVTRVTNDVQTLNEMYTAVLVNLFKDIFMLFGILIVMFSLNYQLALYSCAVLPLVILSTIIFRVKARQAYRQVRVRLARLNANIAENISGMKIVQIFHQEEKKFQEFDTINQNHYQATRKQILAYAIFRPAMEIISSLGLAIVIWFGGQQFIQNNLQLGVLFAFISYIQQFFRPILDLTEKYNIMQAAMASAERIFLLLDQKPAIKNSPTPIELGAAKGQIQFKHVWFAYHENDWVLKDLNFTINPGETVAFVGATGAGKSSIINLLSRFYDIQQGEILLDGKDIKQLDLDHLRSKVGVVLQDVFLFTGNIKSNISLGNPKISDKQIREVARYVNADPFISNLGRQYEEPVTERGSTLSTGQRQLLAFARTLAFNPEILVLDEATANIDTETELLIQDALKKIIKDRTTLIIAHRLSTIQHADKIIVLHKGEIREMGNHQELLAKEGIYYKLYQLQYKEDFDLTTVSSEKRSS